MSSYHYGYRFDKRSDRVVFCFPSLPEIITFLRNDEFENMSREQIYEFAQDAVISALQARLLTRKDIPDGDESLLHADGYVSLAVPQTMKLELFKLYFERARTLTDFAELIGKKETATRRLFDLRHQSRCSEIESAFLAFGRRLEPRWHIAENPEWARNIEAPCEAA
jgi:hypothetical protein